MIGAYFLGNKTIETRPLNLPEPGEGQVLLRVCACGVCGTDVHIYEGGKGSGGISGVMQRHCREKRIGALKIQLVVQNACGVGHGAARRSLRVCHRGRNCQCG